MPLYTAHNIYDINTLECYRDLIKHIESDPTFKPNRDKVIYFKSIRSSVINYARLKGFQSDYTEFAKKEIFYIDQEHASFNNWLCLKLSITEPHEVALILDHFYRNSKKPKERFINEMENYMLKLMKNHVYHDIPEIKKEIAGWIRIERTKLTQTDIDTNEVYDDSFRYENPKPLDFNIESIQSIESHIDTFAPFDWLNKLNSDTENELISHNRIKTDLSFDEIMEYFGKLATKNRKGELIMSMEDIKTLVKSNFDVDGIVDRRLFHINLSKEALKKFVYQFYLKEDQVQNPGKQLEYCHFLINNFESFRNDNPEDISKKLSSASPKYYPFDS